MKILKKITLILIILSLTVNLIYAENQNNGQEDFFEEAIIPAHSDISSDLNNDLSFFDDQRDDQQAIETNELKTIDVMIQKDSEDPSRFMIKTVGAANQATITRVLFPTWSDRNGQDDLKWYQGVSGSDGEYSVLIDSQDHGFETGTYSIHTYFYGRNDKILKVDHQKYEVPVDLINISSGDVENDHYRIRITNPNNPKGISSVLVPTWSLTGGQDDIRWEEAKYIGQNTWEALIHVKDYAKSYDTYINHIYVNDLAGHHHFAGEIRKEIKNPFKEDPIALDFHMYQEDGRFTINTSNFNGKSGVDKVDFAVWSERKGQDDLKWYSGTLGRNGQYSAPVELENHGFESGRYIIHTYAYGQGHEQIAMSGHAFEMEKGKVILEFDQAVLNNTYKLRVKNVSSEKGVKTLYIPTWSRQNGQDDIRWEKASYMGDNTWEVMINLRNYGAIVDDFDSHVYLKNQENEMVFVDRGTKKITQNTQTIYGFFAYPLDKRYKPDPNDSEYWFGPRWGKIHEGIDIPAPYYAKCYSAANGIIERAGYFMGYGRYVRIKSTDRYGESVSFFYGHLREIHVREGQVVSMGQVIGSVGGSGYNSDKVYVENAYGPHLHFGAIANADDACVDPEIWIDFHNPHRNR